MAAIVEEAKSLAAQGYKELILVAQDLTHYGADFKDGTNLAALLRELCAVDGLSGCGCTTSTPTSSTTN